jgi:hypothetical protein
VISTFLAATAIVTTIAGVPGVAGNVDGAANVALFNKPTQIELDGQNVYVVDRVNKAVRIVFADGTVGTYTVRISPPRDFGGPMGGGIAIEPLSKSTPLIRSLFLGDSGLHVVLELTPSTTYSPLNGFHDFFAIGKVGVPGYADGSLLAEPSRASFNTPTAMAIDRRHYPDDCCSPRYVFIADTGNGVVRKLVRSSNLEGDFEPSSISTIPGAFIAPRGLAFGPDGSLYVSDAGANTISRLAPPDFTSATIVAGAPLLIPTGIDVDDQGNVYIADTGNNVIRRLRSDGVLEIVAGAAGESGYADGEGSAARFAGPVGLKIAPDGSLIVADTSNHVIRKITFATPAAQPRRRGVRH